MTTKEQKEIKKFRGKFGRFYYSDEVGMDWQKPKKQNITGGIPDKHSGFCIASDDIENIIIDSHHEIRKAEREKIIRKMENDLLIKCECEDGDCPNCERLKQLLDGLN